MRHHCFDGFGKVLGGQREEHREELRMSHRGKLRMSRCSLHYWGLGVIRLERGGRLEEVQLSRQWDHREGHLKGHPTLHHLSPSRVERIEHIGFRLRWRSIQRRRFQHPRFLGWWPLRCFPQLVLIQNLRLVPLRWLLRCIRRRISLTSQIGFKLLLQMRFEWTIWRLFSSMPEEALAKGLRPLLQKELLRPLLVIRSCLDWLRL